MAPTPKRKISTRRGGKRWRARLNEAKKRLTKLNLNLVHNKHLRKLGSS